MFINIHTHEQIYDAQVELVNLFIQKADRTNLYSYGIHPWYIDENYKTALNRLSEIAKERRCIAIGECGLDKLSKVPFDLQQEVFVEQIKIANEIGKPLIIHCVKAFNELINCLNLNDNQVPVIIHGFNNNENIARILLDFGCHFSFGKALLGYDSNAAKALKSVGRKRFFLETDDSDITIKYIYKKAAEILGVSIDVIQIQMEENFKEVFKMDPAIKMK